MEIELSKLRGLKLKETIKRYKLIPYKCQGLNCGIVKLWKGRPIVLELDHINGNNQDNTITNLRFLCPNCHSQTDTFRYKNNKGEKYSTKNKKVSDEKLISELHSCKNIAEAFRNCGMSGARNYLRAYRLIAANNIYMATLDENRLNGVCQGCKKDYIKNKFTQKFCSKKCVAHCLARKSSINVSLFVLIKLVNEMGYEATGRQLNVSGNTIRKKLKSAGFDPKIFGKFKHNK